MKYITKVGDQEFTVDINEDGRVEVDGEQFAVDFQGIGDTQVYSLLIDGKSYEIAVDVNDDLYLVMLNSALHEIQVQDERTHRLGSILGNSDGPVGEVLIKAPMPGVVVAIPIELGQTVEKGEIVAILESMKMQNEFKSPKDGAISSIRVSIGDKVDQNTIMVTIS